MKCQFCIRFDQVDVNSAASKAVLDCNGIFSANGYRDYTFTVGDNSRKPVYYYFLLKELIRFFLAVKKGSIIGIQYPLLSINSVFKYFIKALKPKRATFFCVIHDLESLRKGGKDQKQIREEVENLNAYDYIIVHNTFMENWLKEAGVNRPMVPLVLFDYLAEDFPIAANGPGDPIAYAGNLSKSQFIYALPQVKTKRFKVYGPNFQPGRLGADSNVSWGGEFSPGQVLRELRGSFGLIWDGNRLDACDDVLGNYLRYNNPHKFSLYIAAGLPVIAPYDSAIGAFIKQFDLGLLIHNLHDLDDLAVTEEQYQRMVANVRRIRKNLVDGEYFNRAIKIIENQYDKRGT